MKKNIEKLIDELEKLPVLASKGKIMKKKLLKKNITLLEFNGSSKGVAYNGENYIIEVKENEEGIIVDVFTKEGWKNGKIEQTDTYWNSF